LLRDRANPVAWAASTLLHVLVLGVGGWWMARSVTLSAPVATALPSLQRLVLTEEGELPVMVELSEIKTRRPDHATDMEATASGGEETARPDTLQAARGASERSRSSRDSWPKETMG